MKMTEKEIHAMATNCDGSEAGWSDDKRNMCVQVPSPPPYGKEQAQSYRCIEQSAAAAHFNDKKTNNCAPFLKFRLDFGACTSTSGVQLHLSLVGHLHLLLRHAGGAANEEI